MEIDELVWIWDRKKMEEYGIHHAEDGRVGSNSKRDGQDRNSREKRRFCQLAKRVAKTLCNSHK